MDPRIIPFGWGLYSGWKEEEVIVIEREEEEEEKENEEEEEEREEEERALHSTSTDGLVMKASHLGQAGEARYGGECSQEWPKSKYLKIQNRKFTLVKRGNQENGLIDNTK